MRHINARISVTFTLDDGETKTFDLDNGTIELEQVEKDEQAVFVYDNNGDVISSTEEGPAAVAWAVGRWLNRIGIRDEEADE